MCVLIMYLYKDHGFWFLENYTLTIIYTRIIRVGRSTVWLV